ncbi:MAG: hypothetical protein GY844_08385 [Bradyrhizobium sp.]|nr:hypothetical protein [Bradyrhizobium sp.]
MTEEETAAEVTDIIADAAPLPLLDAAYALWRRRYRLDTLEGRPTDEDVRVYRTLTPDQMAAKYRWDRDHAQDGPAFVHLKRAHPRADDGAIRQAIITAVKFEDACFRHFEQTTAEYWQRCLHAVALARKEYPGFLDSTYQGAANDVAYYYK